MRVYVLFLFLGTVALAERRGLCSRPVVVTTPFSSSEQALLGQSHTEDCLFGSTSSVFHVAEDDLDTVTQVKTTATKTATQPFKEDAGAKSPNHLSFLGVRKPAFVGKP